MTRLFVNDDKLKDVLSPSIPISENEVIALMARQGVSERTTVKLLHAAQTRNEIRWVAWRGWCLGGRPE